MCGKASLSLFYHASVTLLLSGPLRSIKPKDAVGMYSKKPSQSGIRPHYAPLRTFVDMSVIFLPFFFLLLAVGVAWMELLGSRLLAST